MRVKGVEVKVEGKGCGGERVKGVRVKGLRVWG